MRSAGVRRSARASAASLLEPRVPGGADPGQQRDLLAAQPGRPAAAAVREADILGLEAGATLAQEVGEFALAPVAVDRLRVGWNL